MISTRPIYNSEIEFFRRNDRGIHMPLGQNAHFQDQYETGSHLSNRTTPSSEPENRASGNTRKRVPVACERCRKRKIKCSGNDGENSSCQHCRTSGYGDSCRFLRVSSVETAPLALRALQQPNHRYTPYPHFHHRMSYAPMTPRYNPPSTVQYPTVPSNVDYSPFTGSNQNVDWTRASYLHQYPTYGEEEEPNPYSSQAPPPYILPNTDPMATSNAYYVNSHGVRPQPGGLWSDHPQALPQQSAHLSSSACAVSTEASQHFQSIGVATNLPSDRILPNPLRGSTFIATTSSAMDSLALASQIPRPSTSWNSEPLTPNQQVSAQGEFGPCREQIRERRNPSYRLQELPYSHLNMNESLSSAPISNGPPIEAQNSPPDSVTEEAHSQRSTQRTVSHDSLRSASEGTSVTYGYTGAMAGRSSQQVRSSSGQLSNGGVGLLYCRTQQPVVSRREPGSDDCSPEYSNCPTDSSTRSSVTSISNVSSGY